MKKPSFVFRVLRGGWRLLDSVRRVLHLLVLLFVLAIFIALSAGEPVYVPNSAALVVAPRGVIVDQLTGDPLDQALSEIAGNAQQESLLRDILSAIRSGAADARIKVLYLQLDAFQGAGLSKLQEIADAVEEFKDSGKPVIAAGAAFGRDQYYLAALADDVFLHPMGAVVVEGYGRFVPYYKSALDALYIDYVAWTAGDYKSFTEPYTRDDMSDEDREASSVYLDALWSAYTADVTAARGIGATALDTLADTFAESLAEVGGDAAQLAVESGLVDELLTRAQVEARLADIAGSSGNGGYSGIGYSDYVAAVGSGFGNGDSSRTVAIVTLAGEIFDGWQPPGTIGGDTAAQLIRDISNDPDVRALVLRVDSPGGSAFASEVILEELQAWQQSNRPLVVSMGSVAASGGYWISMSADEIFASPTTITGSIGVGALAPTFPRALERIGVNIDGIGTNALSGQFSQLRGLGPAADSYYAQSVQHLYGEFVSKVADARGTSFESIDAVAQGRVWAGTHAMDSGLVDALGDLDDAVEAAAALAGLEPGDYAVEFVEQQLSFAESVALQFATVSAPLLRVFDVSPPWSAGLDALVRTVLDPFEYVGLYNDPQGLYSLCLCDVR